MDHMSTSDQGTHDGTPELLQGARVITFSQTKQEVKMDKPSDYFRRWATHFIKSCIIITYWDIIVISILIPIWPSKAAQSQTWTTHFFWNLEPCSLDSLRTLSTISSTCYTESTGTRERKEYDDD